MSVFTNLALLASALGGSYYFLEYKPAKKRKRAKRKPPAPACPQGHRPVTIAEAAQWPGIDCVPVCAPGSQYSFETGQCEMIPSPEPVPGPEPMIKTPPEPGQIMLPAASDVAALADALAGVPTALIVPISMKSVFTQKVLPLMLELAPAYPEIQFVELPSEVLLGPMESNVVMLEIGIHYVNGEKEGTSLFLADAPPPARAQLDAAGEGIEATFDAQDVNTTDMSTALNQIVGPLEALAARARELQGMA